MDQGFKRVGFDVRMVRLQPWKLWLLAAVGGAMAIALTIAVAGMVLILVPLFLLGGFVARFLLRGAASPTVRRPAAGSDVIEGHYEILEAPTRQRPR